MALKILAEAVEVIVVNLIIGWFAAGLYRQRP
jgi:F0F1-type ATP synthase assembly protein I